MNRFITSLIVVLAAANMNAQQMAGVPKLVVGITVDQLRGDYLEYLYNIFGEDGFKKLMKGGIYYDDVDFSFDNPDCAAGMATLFTGANPYYHGVISNTLFNPNSDRTESIFNDRNFLGNFTSQTVSPNKLLASTITDELKSASFGLSRIFAVAPELEQALVAGGHSADGAFWIDNITGKWATTAFYKEVPWFLDRYNRNEALDKRIDDLEWTPMLKAEEYNFLPYLSSEWSFKYNFARQKKDRIALFKTTALVNDEINKVVSLFLKNNGFGKGKNPDYLSVTYNAGTYKDGSVQEYSLETQDTYLRLDRNIGELLTMIDQSVGLDNTFIFLSSTGHYNNEIKPSERFRIPTGEFKPKRCLALLNAYLMAIYGPENWVSHYHNQQIYLNRQLIEDKKIDLKEIQTKAAEFVVEFSGIQDVVTSHRLLHGNWNPDLSRCINGFNSQVSGDLILSVQPGWEIVYEDINRTNTTIRKGSIPAPLILYGPQLKAEKVKRTIDARELAPTVSSILRIRSPNACEARPLPEVK